MASDREVLEGAVRVLAEQVAAADRVVDEAHEAGLDDSHPLTIEAKMLRLELLQMKGYLEPELALLVLDCSECGQTVHYIPGVGASPGHWAHRVAGPHGEPAV